MDRGAGVGDSGREVRATVLGVTNRQTRLSDFHFSQSSNRTLPHHYSASQFGSGHIQKEVSILRFINFSKAEKVDGFVRRNYAITFHFFPFLPKIILQFLSLQLHLRAFSMAQVFLK